MCNTTNVSDLPVMEVKCKSCPFHKDSNNQYLDNDLVTTIIKRNIFQSQQICHGTQVGDIWKNRCRGYWDYAFKIYDDIGLEPGKNFKNPPKK